MKTIFLKELREHRVLALIALACFSLFCLFTASKAVELATLAAQSQALSYNDSFVGRMQPLMASDFIPYTGILCAFFGSILGWMQIHCERHRDLWGYLVHRPITPSVIFVAKIAAGLALYVLGAGLPLLAFILWVRQPGNVAAPFEWEMALPTLSLFWTGVVCYFAAMLIGLRTARWYASRLLPIGMAVMSFGACAGVTGYPPSLIIVVSCAGVLFLATWGAFQTHGQYAGQPVRSQVALILSLTVGCSVGMIFLSSLIFNSTNRHDIPGWSGFQVGKDGSLYHSKQTDGLFQVEDQHGKPVLTKEGKPLEYEDYGNHLALSFSCYISTNRGRVAFPQRNNYFGYWKGTGNSIWYYWKRYDRLVGFDAATRRIIGSIGPKGFSSNLTEERFIGLESIGSQGYSTHLHTRDGVYAIDVRDRSSKEVYKAAADDPILGITLFGTAYPYYDLVVVTKSTVHLLKGNGDKLASIPYLPGFPEYPEVNISVLEQTNHFVLWLNPDHQINEKLGAKLQSQIYWFDRENGITKKEELPNRTQREPRSVLMGVLFGASTPSLFVINFSRNESLMKDLFPFAMTYALASAAIGFWVCRRYRLSVKEQFFSTLFILITGPPGLLAYLCAREWPRQEKCAACGSQRSIEQETCAHCHGTFPAPAKNGVEIFEAATAE